MNIKAILISVALFLGVGIITTNVMLYHQIKILPERMKQIGNSGKDTVQVTKVVADNLTEKGKLLYFCGILEGKPIQLKQKWQYSPDIPDEIWEGYAYLSESQNGAKYYLWSQRNDYPQSQEIEGWFVDIGRTMQISSGYAPLLFPIAPRTKSE